MNSELFFVLISITGLFKAETGREIHLLFSTTDEEGKRYYDEDNHVNVKIQASSGNFVKKKIEDNLDGNYTVSFTPGMVGPHKVRITVNGQPLTGSPWRVQVSPHQYKCVFDIETGERQRCISIAVNKETNEIAVADFSNNRVLLLNADHSYSRYLHLELPPLSVAFTTNGELIVLNHWHVFLFLFNEGGEFITRIGNEYLKKPLSVSVAHDGRIIVCDCGDDSVKILSPDGTELLQSFSAPYCVVPPWFAVYHQDMFFVSYYQAHCVKVFSKEGVFQHDIGREGSGNGQLKFPAGLAIDKFNNLIVCDSDNSRLQVFTLDGKFLYTIQQQIKYLPFSDSVAVSNTGYLYVVDGVCVHVFQ